MENNTYQYIKGKNDKIEQEKKKKKKDPMSIFIKNKGKKAKS